MPSERPIIFSAPSVRAILDGTKTQTRRVIQNPSRYERIHECAFCCPHGQPGDRLWVRETRWRIGGFVATSEGFPHERKIPAIHMPRWASRITLEITDVRVQRVQDISEDDALAEGASTAMWSVDVPGRAGPLISAESYRCGFAILWDALNDTRGFGWEENPWVWALTFRRLEAGSDED